MSLVPWSWRSSSRLQIRLGVTILLTMLAVALTDGLGIWNTREQTIVAAHAETTNMARSLADDIAGDFTSLDTILVGLRERMMHDGTGKDALERLRALMKTRIAYLPMVHSLLVLDSSGRLLVSGDGVLKPGMDMGKSATFLHHRDNASLDMFVAPPVRNILDGRWVIKLSRRVNHDDGSFAGVVISCVTTEFFQTFFATFDVGRKGVILMARREGIGLARSPPSVGEVAGRDISKGSVFKTLQQAGQQASYESTSRVDGTVRLSSFHEVPHTPVIVVIGRSKQEVLAGWRVMAQLHVVGLSLVLLLIYSLGRQLGLRIAEGENARGLLEKAVARLTASEVSLRSANVRLAMAEQIAEIGHWEVDLTNGDAVTWSEQVYRIHGHDPTTYTPDLASAIGAYHPDDRAIVASTMNDTISSGLPFQVDLRLIRQDGVMRRVKSRGVRQNDASGNPAHVFGVFMDVTDQKQAEHLLRKARLDAEAANDALSTANDALHNLAMQDALTGLSNRRHFDSALDEKIQEVDRVGGSVALILFDVDRFKQYNDIYGHPAGDACLRIVAQVVGGFANRAGDVACRYGGEEMALILPCCDEAAAMAIAEEVVQAIRDLTLAHTGSERGSLTISAGVAAFGQDSAMRGAGDLVAQADAALYDAKRGGRDRAALAHSASRRLPTETPRERAFCESEAVAGE